MNTYANLRAQTESALGGTGKDGNPDDNSGDKGSSGATAGTAAAQPASRQRCGELDELARRLAACEERLAQLEQIGGAASGSPRKRAQKAKS